MPHAVLPIQHKYDTRSFTLVETLIYVGIVVLVLVFVVTGLLNLTDAYVKARNTRNVNEVGAQAMERIVREVRKATAIPTPSASMLSLTVPMTYAELVKYGSNGTDGATAHWDFSESSGSKLLDKVGASSGDISATTVARQDAIVGKGYLFDGNDVVTLPATEFSNDTQGAIEAVYKYSGTQYQTIFSTAKGVADMVAVKAWPQAGNTHKIYLYRKSGYAYTSANFDNAAYHHVVAQSTGAGNQAVYVDGVLQTLNGSATGWFNTNGDAGYHVGANDLGGSTLSEYFSGVIDELAVYDETHDDTFWRNRYNAAFGLSSVLKTVSFAMSGTTLTIQENSGLIADPISSGKVNITDLTFNAVTGTVGGTPNKTLGARITMTLTSGAGDTAVTKTFTTAAMMRNPQ